MLELRVVDDAVTRPRRGLGSALPSVRRCDEAAIA